MTRIAVLSPEAEGAHPPGPLASGAARAASLLSPCDLAVFRPRVSGAPRASSLWARWQAAGIRASLPERDGSPAHLSVLAFDWLRVRLPEVALFADAGGLAHATLIAREAGRLPHGLVIALLVLAPHRRRMEASGRVGAETLGLMALHLETECARRADALVFADAEGERWFLAAHPRAEALPRFVLGAPPGVHAAGRPEIALDAVPEGEGAARLRAVLAIVAPRLGDVTLRMPFPRHRPGPDPLAALLALGLPREIALRLGPGPAPPGSVVLDTGEGSGPVAWQSHGAHRLALGPGDAPGAVAAALLTRFGSEAPPPAPPAPLRAFLAEIRSRQPPPPPLPDPLPLVSVCLSHFDRPALLREALDSLARQTWPRLEVVLVDDASPSPATQATLDAMEGEFAARGWTLLRNADETWQAAARNRAVHAAHGEFVLVMDDDNLALPGEVEALVRAALATGADAVAALQDLFADGEDPSRPGRLPWVAFWPLGGPASLGLAWNIYGDVNVLFRREAFLALGGYTERAEIGCEDYEMGAALALSGRRLVVLPEALYQYRFSAVNMAKGMSNERLWLSHIRPLGPALAHVGRAEGRLLRLANGIEHRRQQQHGESYWAGAPRARPWAAHGLPAQPTGEAFRAKLGLLAVAHGAAAEGRRILATLRDPGMRGRLLALLEEGA